jgi:hypothetical protein
MAAMKQGSDGASLKKGGSFTANARITITAPASETRSSIMDMPLFS